MKFLCNMSFKRLLMFLFFGMIETIYDYPYLCSISKNLPKCGLYLQQFKLLHSTTLHIILLLVGGYNGEDLSSVEVMDSRTGNWTFVQPTDTARYSEPFASKISIKL